MRDDELKSLLEAEQTSALGYLGGDLSDARRKAMDYYMGQPFGNEVKGRSQVVSTDVADTIEWMLPALMKMFMAGDDIVSFKAQGAEDEEGAKQETEYNNWIFLQDNDGFRVLYSMFKDALLQRTGACKVYPEFEEKEELDDFINVPDDQYSVTALEKEQDNAKTREEYMRRKWQLDDKILWYLKEHTEEQGPPDPMTGMPAMLHSGVWCRTKKSMKVKVEAVPPEEMLISKRAKGDIDEASYLAHRAQKTASELIAAGYPKNKIKNLGGDEANTDQEKFARMTGIDEDPTGDKATSNEAMRLIWTTEAYPLVDYDDDGIAEMRRVVHAGQGTEILENEEWDGPRPFAIITPIIVPHRLIGLSIADQTMEFQLLKSTLWRQILDNLYLVNNPVKYIDPGAVDIDDILQPRVGGIVRPPADGTFRADGIVPIETQFAAAASFPMLQYIDEVKADRTGVTKYNQGTDANSLNKTASGISQIMSASQQRIELIARTFAEGVKRIFMLQSYYIRRYPDLAKRTIRLRNKQYVEMDPSAWGANYDMEINVGLGTGNKDQMLMHLQTIALAQKELVAMQGGVDGPLVTGENVYNALSKMVENSGFKNAEEFFTDPTPKPGEPPKPPKEQPPNPEVMKVQAQIEGDKAKLQMEGQSKAMEQEGKAKSAQLDEQIKIRDFELKRELALMEFGLKERLAMQDHAMKKQIATEDSEIKKASASDDRHLKFGSEKGVKLDNGEVIEAITSLTNALMEGQKQMAQLIQSGDQAILNTLALPKTVKTPDGRVYTAQIATVN